MKTYKLNSDDLMEREDIIGLILVAVFALSLILYYWWQGQREKRRLRLAEQLLWEGAPTELLIGSVDDVVRALLAALNCTWEERNDSEEEKYQGYSFDYQGGHFALILNRNTETITLYFQNMFSLPLAEINEMRAVANWHNEQSFMLRATYDVRAANNEVTLSLRSHFFITKDLSRLLSSVRSALHFCFEARRDVSEWYDKLKANNSEIDPERSNMEWERELLLLNEQELLHQRVNLPVRQSPDERLTLGALLHQNVGIGVNTMSRLLIVTERTQQIDSEVDIDSFDLSSALVGKQPDGNYYLKRTQAMLRLTYTTLDAPYVERTAALLLEAVGEELVKGSFYFRVTLSLPPAPLRAERPRLGEEHHGRQISVLMAFDVESPEQKVHEANYMWQDAMDKAREGRVAELSAAQRMVINTTLPHVSTHMYWGTTYFYEGRYYEALQRFEAVYNMLKTEFYKLSKADRSLYYEACYFAGFCHCSLQQYKQAYFYLDGIFGKGPKYTQEYVNCLTNAKDVRALMLVDRLLSELPSSSDDDEGNEVIDSLRDFLYRRRAYILIDFSRYKEAYELLMKMCDDPANEEFAINELTYLKELAHSNPEIHEAIHGKPKADGDDSALDKWSDFDPA